MYIISDNVKVQKGNKCNYYLDDNFHPPEMVVNIFDVNNVLEIPWMEGRMKKKVD